MLSTIESPGRLLTAHNLINGLSSKIRELENRLIRIHTFKHLKLTHFF